MVVCYFGNYRRSYSRNHILIKGLRLNGVSVLECHTRESGIKKFWSLYRQHQKIRNEYDIMIIGFSGYSVAWLAKLLSTKKIIFDAFVSLYLSDVEDRKKHSPRSVRAHLLSFLDTSSCQLADRVLLDTNAQIGYFIERYHLSREKFIRIFVGSDDEIFSPAKAYNPPAKTFIVHWHGFIVPFDSIETIIGAAALLKDHRDISFRFITRFDKRGKNAQQLADEHGATNIVFHDRVDYPTLATLINQADICLGIFGNHKKAHLVIPNKIYEAAASGKVVITANHNVINEVFTDEEIVRIPPEDPGALAQAIIDLKENESRRNSFANNAYMRYQDKLTPKALGKRLVEVVDTMK